MKLLFITPKPVIGGAEKITSLVANRMAKNGHKTHYACMCNPEDKWEIELDGIITRISFGTGIKALIRLILHIRKNQYDAVFSSFIDINLVLMASKPISPATSLIIRDALSLPFSYRLTRNPLIAKWSSRLLYRFAEIHISQTQEMAESNRKFLGNWYNPTIVHNPIGIKAHTINRNFPKKPTQFLSIGRLTEQKGFRNLIDAFISAHEQLPSIMLDIVGSGEQLKILQDQINQGNAADYIKIYPRQEDLAPYYTTADVYILSSYFEGFCNTALEALAHGIPLIASTKNTGATSLARHMEQGILIPSNDTTCIKNGILELHKCYDQFNPEFIRHSIERNFNTARILDQYESLILSAKREPKKD